MPKGFNVFDKMTPEELMKLTGGGSSKLYYPVLPEENLTEDEKRRLGSDLSQWVNDEVSPSNSEDPTRSPMSEEVDSAPVRKPAGDKVSLVKNYIAEKYDIPLDLNDDALKEAQAQARDKLQATRIGEAGAMLGEALGGVQHNAEPWKRLSEDSSRPVEDIMQRRKALSDQAKLETDTLKLSKDKASANPESDESKAVRDAYRRIAPKVVANIPGFDFLSASDIKENLEKPLDLYQRSEDRRLQYAMMSAAKDAARADRNLKNRDLERLPGEDQEVVKDLARANAKKIAIANQIESVVKLMNDPAVDEGQKLMQGRQLLKTLNSTEGADAIGAEEAKRLGSYLEIAYGNFPGPGKLRVGRSVPEFAEQAALTAQNIRSAVKRNDQQITELYKNVGIDKKPIPQPAQSNRGGKIKVSNGSETRLIDPSDLSAAMADGYKQVQ